MNVLLTLAFSCFFVGTNCFQHDIPNIQSASISTSVNDEPTFKIIPATHNVQHYQGSLNNKKLPSMKTKNFEARRAEFNAKHQPLKYSVRSPKAEAKYLSLLKDNPFGINVLDYNASNDGSKDCSGAFQSAMNYANQIGGAVVYVPSGNYLFENPISIPSGVTLMGSYLSVPSHQMIDEKDEAPTDGTVLSINYGANFDPLNTSLAMITINENALLKGVCIYYTKQLCDGSIPTPYSPTVYMTGNLMFIFILLCFVLFVLFFVVVFSFFFPLWSFFFI